MDRHGNLDNSPASRVLVHLDVFSDEPAPAPPPHGWKDRLARLVHPEPERKRVASPLILSALWRWADQRSVVLEAFATGCSQAEVQRYLDELEEEQQHPFRSGHAWPTAARLAKDLPFRREVVGVCDLPERGLSYGSWWVDPATLF